MLPRVCAQVGCDLYKENRMKLNELVLQWEERGPLGGAPNLKIGETTNAF